MTLCPVCGTQLDFNPRDATRIPDNEITGRVARHLVNVHEYEDDRAADIAAKTTKRGAPA